MMINILTQAITIVFLLLCSDLVSSQTRRVDRCPCDRETWLKRAEEYNCKIRNYTCILNLEGKLVESCIMPYRIFEREDGCPCIKREVQNHGPQINDTMSPCNVDGCPLKNHKGYYVTELYKYPACFIPMEKRASIVNSTKVLEHICKSTSAYMEAFRGNKESQRASVTVILPITIGIIVIVIVISFLITYNRRQQLRKGNPLSQSEP